MPSGKKGRYQPHGEQPYELSRNKLNTFCECPRCFWLDRRKQVAPPSQLPLTLNNAVDELLKREFDHFRKTGTRPPLLESLPRGMRPAEDERVPAWRGRGQGVRHLHKETNFLVYGLIDDLWVDDDGVHYLADYKASASSKGFVAYPSYQRQMEVYQWLLRANGLKVSDTAYFVYASAHTTGSRFPSRLEFSLSLNPIRGRTEWIEPTLREALAVLNEDTPPPAGAGCKNCTYVAKAAPFLEG